MNTLLIVDDHRMFADGIRFLLEKSGLYQIAGMLNRGCDVLPFLATTPVEALLLDIDLPDVSGFDLAQTVRNTHPTLPMLALSMLDDARSIRRMLDAGATGYCIKSAGADELFAAVRAVVEQERYLPVSYLRTNQNSLNRLNSNGLTDREIEIIRLIADGGSTRQIADQLCLSIRTVETHRKNIYRKMGVHTSIELTHHARKYKLL